MFQLIFPKANELAVFVMAVTFYSLFFYVPEMTQGLINVLTTLWHAWLNDFKSAEGVIASSKFLGGLILGILALGFYGIGPLLLPFTKRDIRLTSLLILWINGVLLIYSVIKTERALSPLAVAYVIYYLAWLIYSVTLMRIAGNAGIQKLVSDEQTNPTQAVSCALFSIALTVLLTSWLSFWWLNAYLSAISLTLVAASLLERWRATALKDGLADS
jgi:hypothetical protein